ncbi:hypothetical protein Tco_0488402 [Tanacetum coccineum]
MLNLEDRSSYIKVSKSAQDMIIGLRGSRFRNFAKKKCMKKAFLGMQSKLGGIASASVPWIYIQKFWHTLKLDDSKDKFKFFIDTKEFKFSVDDFRRLFQLPQGTDNNHAAFMEAPTFTEMLPFFQGELVYALPIRLPG